METCGIRGCEGPYLDPAYTDTQLGKLCIWHSEEIQQHKTIEFCMNMTMDRLSKQIERLKDLLDIEFDRKPWPTGPFARTDFAGYQKAPWMVPHWTRGLKICESVYKVRKEDESTIS